MLFLLQLSLSICLSFSLECLNYVDTPAIPLLLDSNNTCTGSYCYRIEKKLEFVQPVSQTAAIMGCFDYPLEKLDLGCRRNFQGLVLCVCQTDRCNDADSSDVVDLPIVRNCRLQHIDDDRNSTDEGKTCVSNYCSTYRAGSSHEGGYTLTREYRCQSGSADFRPPLLGTFDVFAGNFDGEPIPAGICLTYLDGEVTAQEICSCPQRDNCSTPSLYPRDSGLPLDLREEGMVECAARGMYGGMRKCRGHVCYILKRKYGDSGTFGCIRYDESFMDKRYKLGTTAFLGSAFYICNGNMCNAAADPNKVFAGVKIREVERTGNETCNCLLPVKKSSVAVAETVFNLTLLLSITIPVAFILFILAVIGGYRVYTKRWPLTFLCAKGMGRGRVGQKATVISVVSAGPLDTKKKVY